VPETEAEARALIAEMRSDLRVDERTREVAKLVLDPGRGPLAERPLRALMLQAGVDLLPTWARRMHGLRNPLPARPLVRVGAGGLAGAVRWAFSGRDEG